MKKMLVCLMVVVGMILAGTRVTHAEELDTKLVLLQAEIEMIMEENKEEYGIDYDSVEVSQLDNGDYEASYRWLQGEHVFTFDMIFFADDIDINNIDDISDAEGFATMDGKLAVVATEDGYYYESDEFSDWADSIGY